MEKLALESSVFSWEDGEQWETWGVINRWQREVCANSFNYLIKMFWVPTIYKKTNILGKHNSEQDTDHVLNTFIWKISQG